jgi:secondary thiamine-phosphate synthase enzyme
MVSSRSFEVTTRGQGDIRDITPAVVRSLAEAGAEAGTATVFVTGSTAAITTIEFEPGAVADFGAMFERLAPREADYRHHLRWGDDNGSSHVRAALLGPSLSIPLIGGKLSLGTWQQIILVEFDTRARRRDIIVQFVGE